MFYLTASGAKAKTPAADAATALRDTSSQLTGMEVVVKESTKETKELQKSVEVLMKDVAGAPALDPVLLSKPSCCRYFLLTACSVVVGRADEKGKFLIRCDRVDGLAR